MTFSITTLSTTIRDATIRITKLSVAFSVAMLGVIMPNVILPNVVILCVMAPLTPSYTVFVIIFAFDEKCRYKISKDRRIYKYLSI